MGDFRSLSLRLVKLGSLFLFFSCGFSFATLIPGVGGIFSVVSLFFSVPLFFVALTALVVLIRYHLQEIGKYHWDYALGRTRRSADLDAKTHAVCIIFYFAFMTFYGFIALAVLFAFIQDPYFGVEVCKYVILSIGGLAGVFCSFLLLFYLNFAVCLLVRMSFEVLTELLGELDRDDSD